MAVGKNAFINFSSVLVRYEKTFLPAPEITDFFDAHHYNSDSTENRILLHDLIWRYLILIFMYWQSSQYFRCLEEKTLFTNTPFLQDDASKAYRHPKAIYIINEFHYLFYYGRVLDWGHTILLRQCQIIFLFNCFKCEKINRKIFSKN